jgi:hypothetical protein
MSGLAEKLHSLLGTEIYFRATDIRAEPAPSLDMATSTAAWHAWQVTAAISPSMSAPVSCQIPSWHTVVEMPQQGSCVSCVCRARVLVQLQSNTRTGIIAQKYSRFPCPRGEHLKSFGKIQARLSCAANIGEYNLKRNPEAVPPQVYRLFRPCHMKSVFVTLGKTL